MAKALASLAEHPLVGQTRSLGLIGAVEIVARKGTNERFSGKEGPAGLMVRDRCIASGLMVRAIRDTIVMSPPLIISHAEIDTRRTMKVLRMTEVTSRMMIHASASLALTASK